MLEQRIPSNRNRFTGADLDFVASVLAPDEQRQHLEKLWGDPDAMREMLDLKEVFRGLLDSPFAIQVSPRFYFYVLVRHAFLQAELSNVRAGRLRGGGADQEDLPFARGSAAKHRRRIHPRLGLYRDYFQREGADALSPASGRGKPVSGAQRALSGFHQASL